MNALFLLHPQSEAHEEMESVLREELENASYILLAAQIQQSLGKQDEALELRANAMRLKPKSPEIYNSNAVSYYSQLRYAEAQQSVKMALQQEPNAPAAFSCTQTPWQFKEKTARPKMPCGGPLHSITPMRFVHAILVWRYSAMTAVSMRNRC